MELRLQKKGMSFYPAFEEDSEACKKIPQGQIIKAKTERQRNYLLHKKLFVVLQIGFDNQPENDFVYENIEHYRARVLIGCGWCDVVYLDGGQVNYMPKSISYDSVPDDNLFAEIYNKAVTFIANKIMITDEELGMQVASQF